MTSHPAVSADPSSFFHTTLAASTTTPLLHFANFLLRLSPKQEWRSFRRLGQIVSTTIFLPDPGALSPVASRKHDHSSSLGHLFRAFGF